MVSRGGKGAGEFVIVIARRGRAAIAITPRRRSYRHAGLLASATRTYVRTVPTYVRIRRHRRRHFAQPTHIFAPLGDLRKAAREEIDNDIKEKNSNNITSHNATEESYIV